MIIYLYDGTFDGLFTAIFDSYANKESPDKIVETELSAPLLSTVRNITTNIEKAERVKAKIKKILKYKSLKVIDYAFRSNDENKGVIIYKFIKRALTLNSDTLENFADADIYNAYKLFEKVRLETHRFLGFVRFSLTDYGLYYSKILPDNNIVDLLLPHFKKRYVNMAFVIHDEKRNIFACYNNGKTAVFTSSDGANLFKNQNDEFQKLFKKYYDTVNIKGRKNLKTMKNFMPTRYHRNLHEKNNLL